MNNCDRSKYWYNLGIIGCTRKELNENNIPNLKKYFKNRIDVIPEYTIINLVTGYVLGIDDETIMEKYKDLFIDELGEYIACICVFIKEKYDIGSFTPCNLYYSCLEHSILKVNGET